MSAGTRPRNASPGSGLSADEVLTPSGSPERSRTPAFTGHVILRAENADSGRQTGSDSTITMDTAAAAADRDYT